MTEILLPARADAEVAIQTRQDILNAPADERVVIDAAQVTVFSTPLAMVLLSARDRAGGLTLRRPSEEIVDGFSTLGLFAQMMQMEIEG
ncbi:STAS domain-containing protein [Monaibacterium marinum]|uniref:STAS domain-containing protein n=1 Tax=Pontivivens marinum TaxID=1690039 RepID=A0A2C9CNH3_9RHOB|nr:STAS domain-containing protein [Monaibacterium marinum]SOH92758.1 STAS domain-containing protein [Monaibacterium marinum]